MLNIINTEKNPMSGNSNFNYFFVQMLKNLKY